MSNRVARMRRVVHRWPAHGASSVLALTLAVALGAFPGSFVRVAGWSPLRVESRLLLDPMPPADWDAAWTLQATSAQAQQEAAFGRLQQVILALSLVGAVVALVSFVALVLGAASARRRELATREAVGATPLGLGVRLMLEALALGGAALIAGVAVGLVAVRLAERWWPQALEDATWGELLMRALGAGSLIVASGVIASSVLAYAAVVRRPLASALTSGGRVTASPGELRLRDALAVVQFAGVLTLLSGAAILARESRPELAATTAQRASLLIARLELDSTEFREPRERVRILRALGERVRTLPGVEAETLASAGAWLGVGPLDRVIVECGECYRALMYMPYDAPLIRQFTILPNFFQVLGVAAEGSHALESERVALVNRALASAQFQHGKPIGRHVYPYGFLTTKHEVVGVVPSVRAPVLGGARAIDYSMYLSVLQYPPRSLDLLVRADDLEVARDALSRLRRGLPAGVVLHEAQSADAALRELGAPLRFLAVLLLSMAVLVVLLGVHGAYALQRFRVENQRRELSVRLALGSSPRSLTRYVLVKTARLIGFATAVGILGALAAARGVQALFPGAPAFAPVLFIAITLLLVAAALLGSLLPAVRVARLDPAAMLN